MRYLGILLFLFLFLFKWMIGCSPKEEAVCAPIELTSQSSSKMDVIEDSNTSQNVDNYKSC